MRKYIPEHLLRAYHYLLSRIAALVYKFPSEQLIVIGITGTTGKSSTAHLLAKVLEGAGFTVGLTSTAEFKIGEWNKINDTKMTMPGRFQLQSLLRRMVRAGCRYAIVETTSQGILQYRHLGINYDFVLFTNLSPEHIEAHGGFEHYKAAKGRLFTHLSRCREKHLNGKRVQKRALVNLDDAHASYFLSRGDYEKYGFTAKLAGGDLSFENLVEKEHVFSVSFAVSNSLHYELVYEDGVIPLRLLGEHNAYNALAAISAARLLGVAWDSIKQALASVHSIPGRCEFVPNEKGLSIIVDYAHEPKGMEKIYEVASKLPHNRILHILGSAGGGRDVQKRSILGGIAGEKADVVFVTNEDPYDDDPQVIIEQVGVGAIKAGKKLNDNLFLIPDRREAIHTALQTSAKGDIVLVTGKGCEQAIVVKDRKKIPWDDRKVIAEELTEM